MEDLSQIVQAIQEQSTPMWLTIIGIFVPIVLSFVTIFITIMFEKQNKKLQKELHDKNNELQHEMHSKDTKIQLHSDVLNIYNAFCESLNTLGAANNFKLVIGYPQYTADWNNRLYNSLANISQACNHAVLLFGKDDELCKVLSKIYNKYKDIQIKYLTMLNNRVFDNIRESAWKTISTTFLITPGDYFSLNYNKEAYEQYLLLCDKDDSKEFIKELNGLLKLYEYKNFDKHFEKYLKISELS